MKYRTRRFFTEADKVLMWDHWQKGDSLHAIARLFDRSHGAIARILARTGGIRPPQRTRSQRSLTLAEREEISRGVVVGQSLRTIAASLGRAPSTVSREINRNGGRHNGTEPTKRTKRPGIGRIEQRPVNWRRTVRWPSSWQRNCSSSGHRGKSQAG